MGNVYVGINDNIIQKKIEDHNIDPVIQFTKDYLLENMLTDTEMYVLKMKSSIDKPITIENISTIMNCSVRTVSRHYERAIDKMKKISEFLDYKALKQYKESIDIKEEKLRMEK